jgi:hypothetical protein
MFSPSINALWFVAAVLKLVIAALLSWKKLYRPYPFFYAYVLYNVILNAALYLAKTSYSTYFYVYWAGEVLDVVLCFGAIYEIFSHLLSRYDALHQLMSVLFKWTTAVLVFVGIILTALRSADLYHLIGALLVIERSIAAIQTGFVICLFIFASSLGISWKHYAFGICAGFAVVGCTKLVTLSIRTQMGGNVAKLFNVAQLIAYIAAQVIWLSYFASPEPAAPKITEVPNNNLDAWNQALRHVLQR